MSIKYGKLLRLAKFLDTLKDEEFEFSDIVSKFDNKNHCGSVCCAVGWTPKLFPKEIEWAKNANLCNFPLKMEGQGVTYRFAAQQLFGISHEDATRLFSPNNWLELGWQKLLPKNLDLGEFATARAVATNIRMFVKWHKSLEAKKK